MILKGTNLSPAVESPIDNMEVNKSAKRIDRLSYEKRLGVYEDYLKTREGQVALALVDPERKRIDYKLSQTSMELHMTPEQAQEYKLILTGERRVWTRLLVEPDLLKNELDRLEGKEEQENKGKAVWEKLVKRS